MELTASVVYRGKPGGRITLEDYEEAIQELQEAKTQLEPDGDNCHVCHDSGHQAWECHHNPLAMARIAGAAKAYEGNALPWRCFHCGEVFRDSKSAAEHFGSRGDEKPAACGAMLNAFAEMFEQYGVHRNFHNAASVKILNDIWKDRLAAVEAERDQLIKENRRARVQVPLWKGIASAMVDRAKRIKCQFGGDHSMADCRCDPHQLGDAVSTMQDEFDRASTEFTEEQKAAISKAIFDNDYSEMERLKAAGRWFKSADSTVLNHS